MSAKIIWIHAGLVTLFAGGVAAGILYHRHGTQPVGAFPAHGDASAHRNDVERFLEYFRKRLDLSEPQAEKVEDVLEDVHKEMLVLRKEFHERFETIRSRAWVNIRTTLSEEQLPAFEKLIEEMEREHAPTGKEHTPSGDGKTPREDGHHRTGDHNRSGGHHR